MGWTLDASGNLHADEKRMFEGIVRRFKHHKNIIWGKGLAGGNYDLLWYDAASGTAVPQTSVSTPPGESAWTAPDGLGREIALYIHPTEAQVGKP